MTEFAPIVVFAYNRPDHLARTLSKLAQADGASASDLWIFCDGPKPNANIGKIEAVRAVANDPKWRSKYKSVRVTSSEKNKGLAKSIIQGVSAAIDEFGTAIVVEDDLLVAPDFLTFMNECLEFYREDESVGSVTGFCPLKAPPEGYVFDVMAVPRNSSQGWATWADRWRQVDWDAKDAVRVWNDPELRRKLNSAGSDRAFRLRRQLDGEIDSWSIRFGLWQIVNGKNTIYPVRNRIQNIGYDGSGVHSGTGQPKNADFGPEYANMMPQTVVPDPRVLRSFRATYSGSLLRRAVRWLRLRFLSRKT